MSKLYSMVNYRSFSFSHSILYLTLLTEQIVSAVILAKFNVPYCRSTIDENLEKIHLQRTYLRSGMGGVQRTVAPAGKVGSAGHRAVM
jgi:hypothetical protein